MKVNLSKVLKDHWNTLRNMGEEKVSYFDVICFYVVPFFLGVLAFVAEIEFSQDVFSVSISIFAIFSALLLSVQVSMYGVFRSARKEHNDPVLCASDKVKENNIRILLKGINSNVSYLIFVSCFSVSIFLMFFASSVLARFEASISIFLYVHFLLTAAMVLKRAHEVFDAEYSDPIS